jgi:hypothetical protein
MVLVAAPLLLLCLLRSADISAGLYFGRLSAGLVNALYECCPCHTTFAAISGVRFRLSGYRNLLFLHPALLFGIRTELSTLTQSTGCAESTACLCRPKGCNLDGCSEPAVFPASHICRDLEVYLDPSPAWKRDQAALQARVPRVVAADMANDKIDPATQTSFPRNRINALRLTNCDARHTIFATCSWRHQTQILAELIGWQLVTVRQANWHVACNLRQ